jgi:methanogenic corrinoid protein MtbC1
VRLDAAQVVELLEGAFARDGVATAWENTVAPALLAVGRKWTETSGRYVEVEHLLSWCVGVALHRLYSASSGSATHRRVVLLACAPEEWHSLPLEVLRGALAEQGVPVCMLGAAVPTDALLEAARRIEPSRIVVWSQTARTADPTALPDQGKPAARSRGRCVTLAAGPGWLGARPAVASVLTTLTAALAACVD